MHILTLIQRLLCVCVLTARQTDLRLCRRSRASWVLARYWGSSACSSRMENGTMEPGQKGGMEGESKATLKKPHKKQKTGWDEDRGDREGERKTGRRKDGESEMRI